MRIVVKVGTHAIAAKSGKPDHAALRHYVGTLTNVRPPDSVKYFHP